MHLHTTQKIVASSPARFRVLCCGRRWGKTTEAIEEIKGKALSKPSRIVYIAPTYQQARDIAWAQLKAELDPIIVNCNESRLELIVKTQSNEVSHIFLRGWESVETLRGQFFDLMIIDEVAMVRNFKENWEEVLRPTLTDTRGEALFISTPKGFNHFYDLFILENDPIKGDGYKSFHFSSFDNPYLPVDELEKAKAEMTEDRFAQEYLADFRKTEGLVYKDFSRDKHLFHDEPKAIEEVFAGVDFGNTNPCAVLTIKRDYDNTYWVTEEFYQRGKTDAEIADYVAACNFGKVYPDPESPSAILEMKRRGINVRDVIKNKDSVKNGITKVRELFKNNKLKIHQSCENLIWELETYSYPDKKDQRNEEENPIKENDHALDALRYALMMIAWG